MAPLYGVLLGTLLLPAPAAAAEHTGVVHFGQQPIPGAAVTVTSGNEKFATSTDEAGRYLLDLPPGNWTIEVQMFGFRTARREVSQGPGASSLDWELEFAAQPPRPAAPKRPANPNEPEPAFRDVQLEAVASVSAAAAEPPPADTPPADSFLVNGSLSQGLQAPQQEDPGFIVMTMQREIAGEFGREGGQATSPFGDGGTAQGGAGPGTGFGSGVTAPGASGLAGRGGFGGGGPGAGAFGGRGVPGGGMRPGSGRGGRGGDGRVANLTPEQRRAILERLRRAGSDPAARSFGNRRRGQQPAIRGMASWQVGNSAFDAAPYSLSGDKVGKPAYAQNRFNIMLAGPLRIPRLLNLRQTFYTISYNGSRNRNTYSAFSMMPAERERAGDFSAVGATVYDPLTGRPFPGNVIPAGRVNTAAVQLLRFIPVPNRTGAVQNYQILTSVPRNSDALTVRMNQTLTRKHRLLGGLSWQRRDNEPVQLYGFRDRSSGGNVSADLGWTWTLRANLLNDVRIRFSRDRTENLPFFAYGENVAAALGIAGPSEKPVNFGPPNLSFTNYGNLTDGSYTLRRNQAVSVSEAVNLVRGSHTLTAGVELRRPQQNSNSDQDARGTFTFSGLATSGYNAAGLPIRGTGFDFADFLLGLPQSSSIRFSGTNVHLRSRAGSAWLQDNWRVRPNLTINAGVRYEFVQPWYEKYDRLANLDIAPAFTGAAVVTPTTAGPYSGEFPRSLVNSDPNNVSPRIGFAWRPFAGKRFQVRGGYSVFYDGSAYSNIGSRLAAQPPFALTSTITTSVLRVLTIENGFGADATKTVTNTYAVARDYVIGYAQTWNAAISHELPQSFVVEIGYLATKGTHLDVLRQPNRAAPGSPLTAEQRRRIGNAVGFTFASSEANSIFHAAQVRVTRRMRRGLMLNAFYTFGKSIDNASSIGGVGNVVAQNDSDLSAER
ncbi:MAG TPA: TonB-dependent receptor, partial [Bryobacteraceae bacterium]|nr:TonB-dependent receptor [Bryobacteraceae bacterium]